MILFFFKSEETWPKLTNVTEHADMFPVSFLLVILLLWAQKYAHQKQTGLSCKQLALYCCKESQARAEKLCVRVGQLLLLLPLQHATILCVGFDSCTPLEAVLGIFQQRQIIKNE